MKPKSHATTPTFRVIAPRTKLLNAFVLVVALALTAIALPAAQAQTFTLLHTFTGMPDGRAPNAALIDVNGSLYSTTRFGGISDKGTMFKVNGAGDEVVLHSFRGGYPLASLIVDAAGTFYGTAGGGAHGYGIVFKIAPTGAETVLYNFAGTPDGADPDAGLVMDAAGNLYSTTVDGGSFGAGSVFKLDTSNTETVLHSFGGEGDGAYPLYGGLVMDSAGNLYGTTEKGGTANLGTVFEVSSTGTETLLHSFSGPDGVFPYSGLIMDQKGNFYGTTALGGAHENGTVFAVNASGDYSLLHSFAGGEADGAIPGGGLARDSIGNLYGTTVAGGANKAGTIFEVSGKGSETVLHSFKFLTDGGQPAGSLLIDSKGNLFGTNSAGGAHSDGTVFEFRP